MKCCAGERSQVREDQMRGVWRALVAGSVLVPMLAQAEDLARLELNKAETVETRCSLTFLVENKTNRTIDSLKPDLALFNPEGVIHRRTFIEMGPVRGMRTNVRSFWIDGQCNQISAILINDTSTCAPIEAAACVDGLVLSSRVSTIKLYK